MNNAVTLTVTFGKNRYHEHIEMVDWCKKHCGLGQWISNRPNSWVEFENVNWLVDSMFGNTNFYFKDSKHLAMFVLRWA